MTKTHTQIEQRLSELASYMIDEKLTPGQIGALNFESFLYGLHEELSDPITSDNCFDNSFMETNSEIFRNLQEAVLN